MIYNSGKVDLEVSVERIVCKLASEVEIEGGFGTTVGHVSLIPKETGQFFICD